MINNSFTTGIGITLQMGLLQKLFALGPFNSLKETMRSFEALEKIYEKNIPGRSSSATRNYKVRDEQFSEILSAAATVSLAAMNEHTKELKKKRRRKNVIASITLAKKHLTEFRKIIEEARTTK